MRTLVFIVTLTLGLFSLKLSSQAILLEKGESGINIGVGYFTINNASSVSGGIGYSPNGRLDIGLRIGKSSFEIISEYGEFYVIPYLEYFFIKEDSEIPISVSAGIGYQRTTDTGDLLEDLGLHFIGNSFTGNMLITKNFNVAEKMRLLPFLGAQYATTRSTFTDGFDKETSTADAFTVSLGLLGAIKVNQDYFNIAPSIIFAKNSTGFSLFVSYNLNQ